MKKMTGSECVCGVKEGLWRCATCFGPQVTCDNPECVGVFIKSHSCHLQAGAKLSYEDAEAKYTALMIKLDENLQTFIRDVNPGTERMQAGKVAMSYASQISHLLKKAKYAKFNPKGNDALLYTHVKSAVEVKSLRRLESSKAASACYAISKIYLDGGSIVSPSIVYKNYWENRGRALVEGKYVFSTDKEHYAYYVYEKLMPALRQLLNEFTRDYIDLSETIGGQAILKARKIKDFIENDALRKVRRHLRESLAYQVEDALTKPETHRDRKRTIEANEAIAEAYAKGLDGLPRDDIKSAFWKGRAGHVRLQEENNVKWVETVPLDE